MRHNNDDELVEIADDDGRDELVAEITALYENNAINPTPVSLELEKVLRIYLETADSLLDAQNEFEGAMIEEKLDELELIIAELRAAYAIEQGSVNNADVETETMDVFILPENGTVQ
jgi:hypothetical protein